MNIKNIKKINFFVSEKKNKNIHLIGIGGSGMVGIALILLKLGYNISGSDLLKSSITKKLIHLGATIYFTHSKNNVKNVDFIIKSSAISSKNKEIIAAKKYNIPVLLRSEMLEILMNFKFGIAISGTHGKTTTTSMISDIFIQNNLNPTLINGGLIKSIDSHAQLGSSHYFIVEADESDSSFLYLNPKIVILTNIESDHIDHYDNSFKKLKETFLIFLNKIPLYGTAIVCIDNSAICDILPNIKCKVVTYGFNKNADIRVFGYKQKNFIGNFQIIIKNNKKLNIILNIPGKHNALNAAAAIALAINEGVKDDDIVSSLKKFKGTCRRFEFLGFLSIKKDINNNTSCMLIDDYGHHPTELSETIKTIRTSWPKKNLVMIFQPHRYTRTYNLYHDFVKILSQVDVLLILNVYSANEKFIIGADSLSLCNDIKKLGKAHATLISNHNLILDNLISKLNGNDIILIQGAGNIDTIIHKILIKKINK
ncbi:UDP-N-acetylmuramate-alanine ligase [Buchnera aphidicola str. Ak (Acyrthosiphon kondoi)]|uniref:UDP-N-acetylmuramate--L-alanine ligase n=1 Tax=Buchnera aphidicola str. Ak (Acyrthosiphon kondoi) TaxID=1005090 RepID=G2LMT5_9GAMM|nr:UDP-N-acetylmuramate--L-alanine ligase [Buchnera aphidicola]AEO08573.1 UDP-N-acetylmuramate-alanine ligase [Buchnera aphidicola str. Ak (Acyrthosiphon kondoi)]